MKKTFFAIIIILFSVILAYPQEEYVFEIRLASFDMSDECDIEYSLKDEKIFVSKKSELTNNDIKSAKIEKDSFGRDCLLITLNKEAQNMFRELTAEWVGKPLAIFINSELIIAPIVREPVPNGKIMINGSLTEDEIKKIVEYFNMGKI